jgi:isopentenyl diphosphate isomerase/L-lactate dehydrogenase-like FMN-dependent dehydrogenase
VVNPLIPVIRITADQRPEEEERALLFTLDDKEYTLWLNAPSSVMLEYLDIARNEGANVAFSWGMEQMLGEAGYQALFDPRITKDQFQSIGEIVIGQLMGVDRSADANGSGPNRRPGGAYGRRR